MVTLLWALANTNPIIELSQVHITGSCYYTCRPDLITKHLIISRDVTCQNPYITLTSHLISSSCLKMMSSWLQMKRNISSRPRPEGWGVFNPERSGDQSCTKRWRWNKGGSGARHPHVYTRSSWICFKRDTDRSPSQRERRQARWSPAVISQHPVCFLACNLMVCTWRPSQHSLQGTIYPFMCASSILTISTCSSCARNSKCVFFWLCFHPVLQKTAGSLLFAQPECLASLFASMSLHLCTWVNEQTCGWLQFEEKKA